MLRMSIPCVGRVIVLLMLCGLIGDLIKDPRPLRLRNRVSVAMDVGMDSPQRLVCFMGRPEREGQCYGTQPSLAQRGCGMPAFVCIRPLSYGGGFK